MLHEMEQGIFDDEDVNRSKDYSVNDDEPENTITQASRHHVAVDYSRSPQRYLSPYLHHPILLHILVCLPLLSPKHRFQKYLSPLWMMW